MIPQRAQSSAYLNEVATIIVNKSYHLHKALGPGMLEKVYHTCLSHDLLSEGLRVRNEVSLAISYNGLIVEDAFKIDMLVEECFPLELKAVESLLPIHQAQLLTYLKCGGFKLGLLINFGAELMSGNVRRVVNDL